ncbi:MAG: hypothetical protein MZV65_21490 [Chromatiales bacterium]|nr:hypothetical protein [Chromatiales bacterium]
MRKRLLTAVLAAALVVAVAVAADKQKFGTLPEPPAPVEGYQSPAAAPEPAPDDGALPSPRSPSSAAARTGTRSTASAAGCTWSR